MKKPMSYYHIQFGGVPLTETGAKRFATICTMVGYTPKEIHDYLKKVGY